MENKFEATGFCEYFSTLKSAIKENKPEIAEEDWNSESSLQISLDNLSMFGPMSLFKERLQSDYPNCINFEFQDYLENQEKIKLDNESQS